MRFHPLVGNYARIAEIREQLGGTNKASSERVTSEINGIVTWLETSIEP